MKTRLFLILIFLTGFFSFSSGQDFWEQLDIPDSVELNDFTIDQNSIVFLGTNKGIYKTEDDGENWLFCNFNNSSTDLSVSISNTIYVIGIETPNAALYLSEDTGNTWQMINPGHLPVVRLITFSDSLIFYTTGGSIYKSIDRGYTWENVFTSTGLEIFYDIIQKDGLLFGGAIDFILNDLGGVYQSNNQGDSWEQNGLIGYGISSLALDINDNLLAGSRLNYFGVYQSDDNGLSWNNLLAEHIITSIAVDSYGGIYAGCDSDFGPEGVQFSNDNGISWIPLNSGLHNNASILKLIICPNNYIYASTTNPDYLYRSMNPIVKIDESSTDQFSFALYPNPAKDILNIEISNQKSVISTTDFHIINLFGQRIYNYTCRLHFNNRIELNIEYLKPGVYVIIFPTHSNIENHLFVKE